MSRSRRSNFTKEQIAQNQASAKNLLGNFIRNTGGGFVDFATLGATDLDKRGDTKFQKGAKNFFANMTRPPEERIFDSNPTTITTEDAALDAGRKLLPEGELLDRINRMRRNDFLQQSAMREFALGRESQRMKSLARDFAEMTDVYSETAAQRRLMEDKFSPTKISQQRLRAQQGEAALMNAIANQASAGAQIGSLGTGRRFGK